MILSDTDRSFILALAMDTIYTSIERGGIPARSNAPVPDSLNLNCGAFVSLYVEGKLRGCIGTFSEEETLLRNVEKMAISAATSDTRFNPIETEDLNDLKIEISVLSPKQRIYDKDDIILGEHGIYMESGRNRGTLLPQVAIKENWTVEEFLGNCAKYKAGIGWEGWKAADLFIYEAFVFSSD